MTDWLALGNMRIPNLKWQQNESSAQRFHSHDEVYNAVRRSLAEYRDGWNGEVGGRVACSAVPEMIKMSELRLIEWVPQKSKGKVHRPPNSALHSLLLSGSVKEITLFLSVSLLHLLPALTRPSTNKTH